MAGLLISGCVGVTFDMRPDKEHSNASSRLLFERVRDTRPVRRRVVGGGATRCVHRAAGFMCVCVSVCVCVYVFV